MYAHYILGVHLSEIYTKKMYSLFVIGKVFKTSANKSLCLSCSFKAYPYPLSLFLTPLVNWIISASILEIECQSNTYN